MRYGRVHALCLVVYILAEEEQVENFEDTRRIYDEKYDEPTHLPIARRMPERQAFPNK